MPHVSKEKEREYRQKYRSKPEVKAQRAEYNSKYYQEHKEQTRLTKQKWNERNKVKRAEYEKKYRKQHPDRFRAKMQRKNYKKYGLTVEQALALKVNGCEVCKSSDRLHIDHCHKTGKIRGVLCNYCNLALGILKDDPLRIAALLNYLLAGAVHPDKMPLAMPRKAM